MLDVLDIPESPTALAAWLDAALMKPGLRSLVDELTVFNGAPDESLQAEHARRWLGDDAEQVLRKGFAALAPSKVRELLSRPSLLPAVQELVLVDGGPYWQKLRQHPGATTSSPSGTKRRYLLIFAPIAVAASVSTAMLLDALATRRIDDSGHANRNVQMRGDGPATTRPAEATPWVLSRRGILDDSQNPAEVSGRLADAIQEWRAVTDPLGDDFDALRTRLGELWAGCEQLRTNNLQKLPPASREAIIAAVAQLQACVQKQLEELSREEPAATKRQTTATVKRAIDDFVREAVTTLRQAQ